MSDAAFSCDLCKSDIPFGSAAVEVCRNVFQIDEDNDGHGTDAVMTVIDSEPVLTLCAACGNKIPVQMVHAAMQKLLG